ncbi:12700_t:CDS:2, partial [Funneliformis caledonium]
MSELRNQSAFSYPSPATNTLPRTDISLREILDTYRDNNDLLKQILNAKVEEDKASILLFDYYFLLDRRAEEEKYKTEQLRLQCKQVDLEMLKEQKKPPTIYTGVPPINTSTPGFNVKSPSDIHSPYLPMPQPMDTNYSATTPTSATTRLSPPSSATGHDNVSYNGISNSHNHSYSSMSQRPSLTLSIPSFPIITASPTAMHNHSFSTPTS